MRSALLLFTLSGTLLFSARARAGDVAGFTLETGSPDALCPELETAREAVRRRLGSLVVEGRRGWHARYTIGHAPDGHPRDFVRLELLNPDGGVELVRDLPMEGESCRTMAEVIALVLDRHFRGLAASETQSHEASAASERPASEPQKSAVASAPSAAATARPVEATSAPGIRLALELSEELPDPRASVGLRALFPVHAQLLLGGAFATGLTAREEVLSPGVLAETYHLNARAFVAWSFGAGPLFGYVGPGLATTFEHASTSGLPESHSRWRALNGLGLDAGFEVALGPRWFFSATAQADWRLSWASGRFMVDEEEVLTPRPVVGRASLGFGYIFSKRP